MRNMRKDGIVCTLIFIILNTLEYEYLINAIYKMFNSIHCCVMLKMSSTNTWFLMTWHTCLNNYSAKITKALEFKLSEISCCHGSEYNAARGVIKENSIAIIFVCLNNFVYE